jgi:hypothetical protein
MGVIGAILVLLGIVFIVDAIAAIGAASFLYVNPADGTPLLKAVPPWSALSSPQEYEALNFAIGAVLIVLGVFVL